MASALALRAALFEACALVLLLAPTLRQAQELFRKVVNAYDMLGRPVASARQTQLSLTLANRSRVIALPSDDKNVRGYSGVSLLLIDEASRTRDSRYYSVRPMLATSRGRLVALSTPAGKRGWFYEAWSGAEAWDRVKVTADQCPRIPAEFLAEERRALGERFFRQEYEVSFEENTDAVFSWADIEACGSGDAKPLFAPGT